MRAVVVYESMYGNTHLIADAVAEGLRSYGEVVVTHVDGADLALARGVDLVVVGGPTHAHGMTSAQSRKGAVAAAEKPNADVHLDPDAEGEGLRDWFKDHGPIGTNAAAFDTRFDMPAAFTGRASKGIAKRLRHHGATLIDEPRSFFVTKQNELEPDEQQHARMWGDELGAKVAATVSR